MRNLGSGVSCDGRPVLPFSHSRTLVGNFSELNAAYKQAFRRARGQWSFFAFQVLVQPMEKLRREAAYAREDAARLRVARSMATNK